MIFNIPIKKVGFSAADRFRGRSCTAARMSLLYDDTIFLTKKGVELFRRPYFTF